MQERRARRGGVASRWLLLCLGLTLQTAAQQSTELETRLARVQTLQQTLVSCTANLSRAGVSVQPENTTLATAQLFSQYIPFDTNHTMILAQSIAAFNRHPNITDQDISAAQLVPLTEATQLQGVLQRAVDECNRMAQGGSRPHLPILTMPITFNSTTGAFQNVHGEPLLLTGYNEAPSLDNNPQHTAMARALGVYTYGVGFNVAQLMPTPWNISQEAISNIKSNVVAQGLQGRLASLTMSNGRQGGSNSPTSYAMPAWARDMYPEINRDAGQNQFCSYDIDHPVVREIFNQTLSALMPAIIEEPALLDMLLANEPGYERTNSSYTLAKFVIFLQDSYNNSIALLNSQWHTNFSSFDDPRIAQAMSPLAFGQAQTLVWERFNMLRVTDFYTFLHTVIQDAAGGRAKLHVKTTNSDSLLGPHHYNGIDRQALGQLMEMHDCDTRAQASSKPHLTLNQYPPNTYALDWVTLTASYRAMQQLSTEVKPVIDSEWHVISTVSFRNPDISWKHVRACTWLGSLHGLSLVTSWYWGRADWEATPKMSREFAGADFAYSQLNQPQLLDTFVRAGQEVSALGHLAAPIRQQKPQVYLFFSELSAILAPGYMEFTQVLYSLLAMTSLNVGFAYESDPDLTTKIQGSMLVLPPALCTFAPLPPRLRALHQAGTAHLVLATNSSLHNQTFTLDELAQLASLPTFVMDGLADASAFAKLVSFFEAHGPASPALRCTQPTGEHSSDNVAVVGEGKLSNVFGLLCFSASAEAVVLINVLNATIEATVSSSSGQNLSFYDAWTGDKVNATVALAPLDVLVLTTS